MGQAGLEFPVYPASPYAIGRPLPKAQRALWITLGHAGFCARREEAGCRCSIVSPNFSTPEAVPHVKDVELAGGVHILAGHHLQARGVEGRMPPVLAAQRPRADQRHLHAAPRSALLDITRRASCCRKGSLH